MGNFEKNLEMVHFQLTRNCNLHCWFCGQWGKKGFFSNSSGSAMTLDDWKRTADSLVRNREITGASPAIMLWGGEPLLSPYFEEIVCYLKERGFELGMVTNGTLLDKHLSLCRDALSKIYVSIDGPSAIHNSIRGEGVFEKVSENLQKLKFDDVTVMSVLTAELLDCLEDFPYALEAMKPKRLYLQEMIVMSEDEINRYAEWLKSAFGMTAKEIYSWQGRLGEEYYAKKDRILNEVLKKDYPFPVIHLPHGNTAHNCYSSQRHMHIAWNGNVLYCTDFYDFSAGNVKEIDVIDIFNNSISDRYREEIAQGNCPSCNHCSWKNNDVFNL